MPRRSLFSRTMRRGLLLVAIPALSLPLFASNAFAIDTKGAFDASITASSNGGAVGHVSDTINPGVAYTTVLTASGGGTCLLATGEVTITGVDTATGNPSNTSTAGACNLFNGTVQYTLTWTSVLGTSGQLQKTCVWADGIQVCTPSAVHGQLPLLNP